MDMHRRYLLVTEPPRPRGGTEVSDEIEYDVQFTRLLSRIRWDALLESPVACMLDDDDLRYGSAPSDVDGEHDNDADDAYDDDDC